MGRLITLLCGIAFLSNLAQGQFTMAPSVIGSGGGYAENESISLSWTLGELAVNTLSGGDFMLTQGFQQPLTLGVGMIANEANWNISVYPNPVNDELHIRFDIPYQDGFMIEIQDVTGRLIRQILHKKVNPGDILVINTSTYPTGIYFLKVLTTDKQQIQVLNLRKL
ncbi:MAG: T9SS type A sorting domain-containing protein [Bacteroidota bacterium]